MTLLSFIYILKRNFTLLFCTAAIAASGVYLLTKDAKKMYSSKTVINTGVVSGYTILNHNSDSRIDREYTRSELQNLLALASSYETTEELAFQLLATYISKGNLVPKWITQENKVEIDKLITEELVQEVGTGDYQSILNSIQLLATQNEESNTKDLIYSDNKFFGIEHLQTIKKRLKSSSDLIEFSYSTEDPAICQKTLELLTKIFLEKHRSLKEGQSKDVLEYFKKATEESALKLKEAEDKLLTFRINNNIINYYEQTRFIADKKEDIDEFLFKEKMTLKAAESAKEKLDYQLEKKGLLSELNSSLIVKRDELRNVTKNISTLEFLSLDQNVDKSTLQQLLDKKEKILNEMSSLSNESQKLKFSDEGIASNNLLSKWLESMIAVEESSSRIQVINQRRSEFKTIYKQFAPWGSQLKKIEREIALAEDAYLENLHSYNQARLHLQNTVMSSNLKIMESPIYPVQPENSKSVFLIGLAFIGGFILPLTILILLDFLDETLKNPLEASERLNIPICGAIPLTKPSKNWSFKSGNIDYVKLLKLSTNHIIKRIGLPLSKFKDDNRPEIMGILSMREKEGVSFVSKHLLRSLNEFSQALHLKVDNGNLRLMYNENEKCIPFESWMLENDNLHSVIKNHLEIEEPISHIIIELPHVLGLNNLNAPLTDLDQLILVCKSNRVWSNSDKLAWQNIINSTDCKPQIIVNGVDPIVMEDFIGEVPKTRSLLRRRIKAFLKFNFSKSELFTS